MENRDCSRPNTITWAVVKASEISRSQAMETVALRAALVSGVALLALLFPSAASACIPGAQQPCFLDGCPAAYQICGDCPGGCWGPCTCPNPPICTPGQTQSCSLPGCPPAFQTCLCGGYCWSDCTCPPIEHSTYYSGSCGCINAEWDAPRGSLVLINSGTGSAIRPILDQLGETFSHEMVVQGPGSAAQSEYKGPVQTSSCDFPLDAQTLQRGFPGMEKNMNAGAIFADIYGQGSPSFSESGSQFVIWMLGDPARATAIANALDAMPSDSTWQPHPGEYIHLILHNGARRQLLLPTSDNYFSRF